MIRVFVSGMLAGMGLYSEVQKMKLEAALKAAQTEVDKLKTLMPRSSKAERGKEQV